MKPEGLVDNNLTDPDKGAWCHSSTSYPQWVTFDLGQPLRLDEVRIMGRNKSGHYDGGPKQFEIQGSTDNIQWKLLNMFNTTEVYKAGIYKKYRLAPIEYRYYKIEITETEIGGGYISIGRIAFSGTVGGSFVSSNANTTVSADSTYSGYSLSDLLKNTVTSGSLDAWAPTAPTFPQSLIFDTGKPTVVEELSIMPQRELPNRSPRNFKLFGSNDRGVWEPIKTFNGKTGWATDTWRSFSLVEQDES